MCVESGFGADVYVPWPSVTLCFLDLYTHYFGSFTHGVIEGQGVHIYVCVTMLG